MNKIKIAKKQTLDGILFLQGVFKKDCKRVEDFFHERLLHDGSTENKMYDKIPLVFTGIDAWIKNTIKDIQFFKHTSQINNTNFGY